MQSSGRMVRKPYEKPSTVVARTQPDVVQPVTMTVSRCCAVSNEMSGGPWKNEGHFLGRRTSESSQSRPSTSAQRESGVISAQGGSLIVQRPSSASSRQQTTVWKMGTETRL